MTNIKMQHDPYSERKTRYAEYSRRTNDRMLAYFKRISRRASRKRRKELEQCSGWAIPEAIHQLEKVFCVFFRRDDLTLHSYNDGLWVLRDSSDKSPDYTIKIDVTEVF